MVNLGAEMTSLIGEGPWIFVGVRNAAKVSSYFGPLFLSLSQSCLICRIITCKPIMWLWLQRLGMFRLLHISLLIKGQFLSMVVGNDTFAGAGVNYLYSGLWLLSCLIQTFFVFFLVVCNLVILLFYQNCLFSISSIVY